MIQSQILQPIVVLLAWTMIMWLWMYATRIPAMSKAGIDPNDARRTKALDETLPAEVEQGVNALEGVARASIDLVFVPSYSMEMLSEEARMTLGFM